MEVNKLDCNVCYEEFDLDKKCPIVLPVCGHTFCISCVEQLIKNVNVNTNMLECPICKKRLQNPVFTIEENNKKPTNEIQVWDYNEKEYKNEVILIKNYALIEIMSNRKIKNECVHAEKKYFCFDQTCSNKGFACFGCVRKFHSSCQDSFLIKKKDFKLNAEIVSSEINEYFDAEEIIQQITEKLEEIKRYAISIVENHQKMMLDEFSKIAFEIEKKPELIFENDHLFEVVENPKDENNLIVQSKILLNLQKVSEHISKIPEMLFRNSVDSIHDLLINSVRKNHQFYKENLKIDSKVVDSFNGINVKLASLLYMPEYKKRDVFDLNEFLNEVYSHTPKVNLKFFKKNKNYNPDHLKTIKRIVEEEVSKKPKDIYTLTENIKASLEKTIKYSTFRVVFRFGENSAYNEPSERIYFNHLIWNQYGHGFFIYENS